MGKLKALLLTGAVAFGAVGSVHAADLPPPPAFEPMAPEPVEFGGWYLRGDVGVGSSLQPDIRSTFDAGVTVPSPRFDERSLGDTAFVGGGVGYQLNNWLRFDATGEYRTAQSLNAVQSYNAGYFNTPPDGSRSYDTYTGQVQSTVALANVYLDAFHWNRITGFVGGGIGASFNRVSNLTDIGAGGSNAGFGYAQSRSGVSLAYQGTVGLAYDVTPNLKLEIAYRYLDMGDVTSARINCQNTGVCPHEVQKIGLASQDVKIGMRWLFGDVGYAAPAPAPYYPPAAAPYYPRRRNRRSFANIDRDGPKIASARSSPPDRMKLPDPSRSGLIRPRRKRYKQKRDGPSGPSFSLVGTRNAVASPRGRCARKSILVPDCVGFRQ